MCKKYIVIIRKQISVLPVQVFVPSIKEDITTEKQDFNTKAEFDIKAYSINIKIHTYLCMHMYIIVILANTNYHNNVLLKKLLKQIWIIKKLSRVKILFSFS